MKNKLHIHGITLTIVSLLTMNALIADDSQRGIKLYNAAARGELEIVKKLIAADAPIDFRYPEEDHWTPLQVAAYQGHTDVVKALADAGASIELKNDAGYTALYAAIKLGNLDTVKYLVEKRGADVNTTTLSGSTPLIEAARMGRAIDNVEIVKFLLNWSANPVNLDLKTKTGETALSLAQENGLTKIVKLIQDEIELRKELPIRKK